MEQTSHHAVEEIEDGTYHDKEQSQIETLEEGIIGSDAAGNQVATGDRIGYMLLHRLLQFCDDGLVAGSGLIHRHTGFGSKGQEDVHTRA